MSGAPVPLSCDGACLRLVLDRPDAGNAIDQAVADAFTDAVAALESLPGSIVVLEAAEISRRVTGEAAGSRIAAFLSRR